MLGLPCTAFFYMLLKASSEPIQTASWNLKQWWGTPQEKKTQEWLQIRIFSRTIKQFHKVLGCRIFRLCHVYMFLNTQYAHLWCTCYILTVYTYIDIHTEKKYIYINIRIHILGNLSNLEMMTPPPQFIDICNITLQQFGWANHHFCLTPWGLGGDIFLDDLTILSLPFHHKTDIHHKHWEKLSTLL